MTDQTMVLLGAGASKDAGLPDSFMLTEMILDDLRHNDGGRGVPSSAAWFVYHTLAAASSQRETVGRVDVERFGAAISLLGSRNELPIAPFVERWHRGIESFETLDEGVQQRADALTLILRRVDVGVGCVSAVRSS